MLVPPHAVETTWFDVESKSCEKKTWEGQKKRIDVPHSAPEWIMWKQSWLSACKLFVIRFFWHRRNLLKCSISLHLNRNLRGDEQRAATSSIVTFCSGSNSSGVWLLPHSNTPMDWLIRFTSLDSLSQSWNTSAVFSSSSAFCPESCFCETFEDWHTDDDDKLTST